MGASNIPGVQAIAEGTGILPVKDGLTSGVVMSASVKRQSDEILPARSGDPVGLIAGWGDYPIVIAEALQRLGRPVYCLAIKGEASAELARVCTVFRWTGLGKLGFAVRFFRRNRITEATMAGKIHKTFMFRPGFIWRHMPDWLTIKAFFPFFVSGKRNCNDDALLSRVVEVFADHGIRLRPATDYLPELLIKQGVLTRRKPTAAQIKDIAFGWRVAKQLGKVDVGQTVCVKSRAVLAVEAVEGTDACIRRAGQLCRSGGFTVVKVAKPQQDMRFDVPTVGIRTLESMRQAGAAVLAVEADKTIVLHQPEFIRHANEAGLVVVAITEEQLQQNVIKSGELNLP